MNEPKTYPQLLEDLSRFLGSLQDPPVRWESRGEFSQACYRRLAGLVLGWIDGNLMSLGELEGFPGNMEVNYEPE